MKTALPATLSSSRAPAVASPPSFPWMQLLLHPAYSLPTAASPVLIGAALALHDGVFSLLPVALAFASSWLVHVGGLYMENYWLLTRHADLREHPDLAAAVENGSLPLAELRRVTLGCFLLAAFVGSFLAPYAGILAPVFGVVGIVASLGYCTGRFSWMRLGIGEFIFFGMFGCVAVVGTYYCQAAPHFIDPLSGKIALGALPLRAFVLGLPLGALVTNVMLIDDLSDIAIDRAKGWRTRPATWGPRWARREYAALMALAYALPLWFWRGLGFDAWILLPWVSAPFALWTIHRVYVTEPAEVEPRCPKTAVLALLYALLLSAGIVIGRVGSGG